MDSAKDDYKDQLHFTILKSNTQPGKGAHSVLEELLQIRGVHPWYWDYLDLGRKLLSLAGATNYGFISYSKRMTEATDLSVSVTNQISIQIGTFHSPSISRC